MATQQPTQQQDQRTSEQQSCACVGFLFLAVAVLVIGGLLWSALFPEKKPDAAFMRDVAAYRQRLVGGTEGVQDVTVSEDGKHIHMVIGRAWYAFDPMAKRNIATSLRTELTRLRAKHGLSVDESDMFSSVYDPSGARLAKCDSFGAKVYE